MTLGGAEFKLEATEFVPIGTFAKTEESFPDLLNDAPPDKKKGKKGGKGAAKKKPAVVSAPIEDEVDINNPWKGKASSFFVMKFIDGPSTDGNNPDNCELNEEQWNFIYEHYPQYGAAPYQMMNWVYGCAVQ